MLLFKADFQTACEKGEIRTVETLLKQGVSPNTPIIKGLVHMHPLYFAMEKMDEKLFHLLMDYHSDWKMVKDVMGNTAIMLATAPGDKSYVDRLLEAGAVLTDENLFGQNLVDFAIDFQPEIALYLLEKGAPIGEELFKKAVYQNAYDVLSYLIELGEDINKDIKGVVAAAKTTKMMQYLVDNGLHLEKFVELGNDARLISVIDKLIERRDELSPRAQKRVNNLRLKAILD
jgi:hypothetical protein